ncbi:hypothetical protein [Rhodobacteraceae bacterium DSL-40]|uniref:hypothetical protein n=1 Tax=Amaricoccus sp. B4 TaxID=3368557 RepID=UPI000DAD2253
MKRWHFALFGILLGTATAWLLYPSASSVVLRAMSGDRWFHVHSVDIEDAVVGDSPVVHVVREIRRPFTASWIVTLRRRNGADFAVFCAREGRNDYRPSAVLPAETDLNWWMNIPPNPNCPGLLPGTYILSMSWSIEVSGLPPKVMRIESNEFEVRK